MRCDGALIPGFHPPLAAVILLLSTLGSAAPGSVAAQSDRADAPVARGRTLDQLIELTAHYIPEFRREAMQGLAALGPAAAPALPVLIRGLRDDQPEVRQGAVEALRRVGPAAAPASAALLLALVDDVRPVQQGARLALEAIGPTAAPALLPALRSPDPWVRANAAEALGMIGSARGGIVARLVPLLADDSLWVRASAAWALGHFGREGRSAVRPLTQALDAELRRDPAMTDQAGRVRIHNLVFALGRIGKDAGSAVPLLVTVLFDGGDSLRPVAAVALSQVGSHGAGRLGAAVRSHAPLPVRLEAARALRLMGPEGKGAVADLQKVLETTDELEGGHDLVIAVADALGAIGKPARRALPALERQRKMSVTPDVVAALDRAVRKIRFGA